MKGVGFDSLNHQIIAYIVMFLFTVALNMLVVWLLLMPLSKAISRLRSTRP